ncbi:hypothetical protein IWX46DRAFT_592093 [Phyllosticta citricarpa]|uniref:Uncharacterized protein n=1 Tax=Phyllosticta citricarpa TaxID=55181 RepID=A0ABR1MLK8_9PEZI
MTGPLFPTYSRHSLIIVNLLLGQAFTKVLTVDEFMFLFSLFSKTAARQRPWHLDWRPYLLAKDFLVSSRIWLILA